MSEDYSTAWEDLENRRDVAIYTGILAAPTLLIWIAALESADRFHGSAAWLVLLLASTLGSIVTLGAFFVAMASHSSFCCPRCKELFFVRHRGTPWFPEPDVCTNCGLAGRRNRNRTSLRGLISKLVKRMKSALGARTHNNG